MVMIGCVRLPNLPIALARRDGPAPVDRPLILYAVERQRAVVYAASDDAGLAAGTPLRQARLRCPQATCLTADPECDRLAVTALARLLGSFSPRVALAEGAPDVSLTLDLGTIAPAQAIALAARLRERIRAELGLLPAIGLASAPLVARHAAIRAGAGLAALIPPGAEAAFLAPQPIGSLPLDAAILGRLDRLGLRTVGDVARLPIDALQAQFGGTGTRLYQLARGIDTTSITATTDAPAISRARRFAGPLLDRGMLERVIGDLAAWLAARLLAEGWAAGAVGLTLDCEDGAPLIVERRLVEPTSDARVITQTLLALSRAATFESGVTAVTASAVDLAPAVAEQLDLFAPAGGSARRLDGVLDRLAGRFDGSLLRAWLTEPTAQLPERRIRLERR